MSLQLTVRKLGLLLAIGLAFHVGSGVGCADDGRPQFGTGAVSTAGTATPAPTVRITGVCLPDLPADPIEVSPAPVKPCGTACAAGCPGGTCCSQDGCCTKGPCPRPLVHCTPKPPKIKFKCVCGKPVCNPCDLEGYGYNPTCWRPWTPPLSCPNLPPSLKCSTPDLPPLGPAHPTTETLPPPPEKVPATPKPFPEGNPEDVLPPIDR
jgi:hypothetical protein